jgi:uncharacterized protein (TIGR02145 family)
MEKIFRLSILIPLIVLGSIANSCKKENLSSPAIETTEVFIITPVSIIVGGNLINDGGGTISSSGICWSINQNPTITDSKTTDGTGTVTFISTISGLVENTTYYVRAYATNRAGTGYGEQIQVKTSIDYSGKTGTLTDIDGNIYPTIGIGNQIWTAQNLSTTKFNNGTSIPLVTSDNEWSSLLLPGYCWYNNDESGYKNSYGALYNWYSINTGNLCPAGWHVPSELEWHTLIYYLGDSPGNLPYIESTIGGGKIKESGILHWKSPNTGATNESGFTALPSGERGYDGSFYEIGSNAFWWSSSEKNTGKAWYLYVNYDNSSVYTGPGFIQSGLSVRCIKDN